MKIILLSTFLAAGILFGQDSVEEPLMKLVPSAQSKVTFSNDIEESQTLNYFTEDNLYNGAGVAVGDLNNDGLADIYFVSNQGEDQIYLNKGNLKFKNITGKALGQQETRGWKTGVLMADFNNDGWLDIYVTRYGLADTPMNERTNLLYINNQNLTFTEKAIELGLGDPGRSIHAVPLDYDQDGDLDLFVVNHWKNASVMDQYKKSFIQEKPYSNKLYRNENGQFKDITSFQNGTETHGYCLGAAVTDVNNDGWPDIYITNDYNLPDFLLINRKDGTFENEMRTRIRHTSHYSMGVDAADFTNDGHADIVVLDMSNKEYKKSKTNMGGMSIDHFWHNVAKGYPHQYMYNTLFLNHGAGYYSEIAHMAGVASSDWSWAPLLVDLDGDGYKDLIATNGYFRDVRDRDFTEKLKAYLASEPPSFDIELMTSLIPQSRDVNYFYRNKGDLTFKDVSKEWGFTEGSISHGAAYADLDNDGDLDLVINNLNEPAQIYENRSAHINYLNIRLKGPALNPKAVGAKVVLRCGTDQFVQELYPARGYASSCDYQLSFGLGDYERVDFVEVFWNSQDKTELTLVDANQTLVIDYRKSLVIPAFQLAQTYEREDLFAPVNEAGFDDFKRELLIPNKMSGLGPFMSKGDVNGDGKDDLYLGGGHTTPGLLFIADDDGLILTLQPDLTRDAAYEDGESVFFDADGDGDLDLYVVSGSNEFPAGDSLYQDRLYLNNGEGLMQRNYQNLPQIGSSGQCVKSVDIDSDGDMDLIVGGRQVPGRYPSNPESVLLINEQGKFTDQIDQLAPGLKTIGMITDIDFGDFNGDGVTDMIIVGEWMRPQFWIWNGEIFEDQSSAYLDQDGTDFLYGWWNCLEIADMNNDGVDEILLGNLGLNNKFHPGPDHPLKIYLEDFDDNGQYDIVMSKEVHGIELPVRGRECLSQQMPVIANNFQTYNDFANATFSEIFKVPEDYHFVTDFRSGMLIKTEGYYRFQAFPNLAQIGPINEIIPIDLNGDEYIDFVVVGNKYEAEIETPRYDGNPGLVLMNNKDGAFRVYPLEMNGSFSNKNAKDALIIGNQLLISNSFQAVFRARVSM